MITGYAVLLHASVSSVVTCYQELLHVILPRLLHSVGQCCDTRGIVLLHVQQCAVLLDVTKLLFTKSYCYAVQCCYMLPRVITYCPVLLHVI